MGARQFYTEEFKRKIVELRRSGRTVLELSREYKITTTSIRAWERQIANSGEFGVEANESQGEKELKTLKAENRQLKMENDILKQAALILGRKEK